MPPVVKNGFTYEGYWNTNLQKTGKGVEKFEGSIREGFFFGDFLQGYGRYFFPSGSVYIGEFRDGLSRGQG